MQETTAITSSPYADDLLCPDCGYSLRGLTSERCPECGLDLEQIRKLGTSIPWVYRRRIGGWRAYWRTVWRVTFRGRRTFREIPELVVYADVQRFRWITIGLYSITGLLIYFMYCLTNPGLVNDFKLNGWYRSVQIFAGILAVVTVTGLPSYLFHPRQLSTREQDRAIAMSYYTCAPLALVFWTLPFYAIVTVRWLSIKKDFDTLPWFMLIVTVMAIFVWWMRMVRLACNLFRRRWTKIRAALLVPVLWLIVGGLVAAVMPWLVLYAVALIYAVC